MLALTFICAYKIVFARQYRLNHQGCIVCTVDQDPVTAEWSANVAPEFAAFTLAIPQQHNTLAAVGHQHQRMRWGFFCHLVVLRQCIGLLYLPKAK